MKKKVFILGFISCFSLIISCVSNNELGILDSSLGNGILLYYEFDGDLKDESIHMFHGISDETTFVSDRKGVRNSAIQFDGVNDFIAFPNISDLKPILPVSFSFWIKYESNDVTKRIVFNTSYEENVNSGVFFTSQSATGNYSLGFGDGTSNYTANNRRSYVNNSSIENDTWKQITIIVNSAVDMKIYVDGIEHGGVYSGGGGALSYSEGAGVIGKHDQRADSPGYYFKGCLDDFGYWDRALTETEIGLLCEKQPRLD